MNINLQPLVRLTHRTVANKRIYNATISFESDANWRIHHYDLPTNIPGTNDLTMKLFMETSPVVTPMWNGVWEINILLGEVLPDSNDEFTVILEELGTPGNYKDKKVKANESQRETRPVPRRPNP